jgi:myo-inositol-1(or 4)-monophosphatase
MPSISANLNIMIKASEKASKGLIRDFGELEQLQVSIKGPSDFVTNADTKAEKIIIDELTKSRKNYSILSEESGSKENKDIDNVWIIDPIDGTINFLHGVPHFAISIALKSNNEIVSGLIYDPIKDEMFYAEKNNGAYFNNKRIRVSKRKKIEECLFASGEIDNENIKQKINSKLSIRKSGSAALDMAYVASGRYDGYFQKNLNLWDIAAGIIIVKEAGGQVNDLNLKQNNNIDIIASSSSINEKLLKNLINF